jgi:Cdc6-like AAA superfamily ATPase
LYGERGVGKTSLANVIGPVVHIVFDRVPADAEPSRLVAKAIAYSTDTFESIWRKIFDEIAWVEERAHFGLKKGNLREFISVTQAFGLQDSLGVNEVRRTLAEMPGGVFIVDEFDRAVDASSAEFTDLIKALSDFSVDCTVILVGVSDTVDALVADHASIGRALVQVHLRRMDLKELKEILQKAQEALGISFTSAAENLIVHVSQGFPHYTHLLGREAVRLAVRRKTRIVERQDAIAALKDAVKQAQQSVTDVFLKATHSAQQNTLYSQVLLACALASATSGDRLGYFNAGAVAGPLAKVTGKTVPMTTFNRHLKAFCDPQRGSALERTGQSKAYRYRFRDPLLVPFVFMEAVATGTMVDDELSRILARES